MTSTLIGQPQSLTGWGRTNNRTCLVARPHNSEQLSALVAQATKASLIPRGLGRSYGDAALNDGAAVIDLACFDGIALDTARGTVSAGGGVSLDAVLREVVPEGFFLPVTPGTRNVTVGGAIAADVHGKNHHGDGSFGCHVLELELIDGQGEHRLLSPVQQPDLFWASVGGMGLTGVITRATFRLIPITSALVSVDTDRYGDLDSLMAAMVDGDAAYRYSVAWVDSLDPHGRGVLTRGDHAGVEALPLVQQSDPLHYDPKALAGAPAFLPGGLLNTFTVRLFNEGWYRKAPKHRVGELQAIAPFFHPLDGVSDWNRIYGPGGFLQYQFLVPDSAAHLVPHTLEVLRRVGAPSFLTVLKRFGPGNPAPLSFPQPGWTLAADVPATIDGLLPALNSLDEEVASAGGRLYLAKDSRQSAGIFQRTYPRLEEWRACRAVLDPRGVFSSDLAVRLGI